MAILSNINGKFAVESTGAIQFSGQNGSAGYVLKSNGNAAPTWIPQSDIVGAYLPLSGGTLTGATATASGISFTVGGTLSVTGLSTLIGGGNFGNSVSIVAGHGNTLLSLQYPGFSGANQASLDAWASEPGVTYNGSGIGANILNSPYYGRRVTNYGQTYLRFINGQAEIYTGAAASGTASTAVRRFYVETNGNATFAKNISVTDGSLLINKSDGAFISLLHNSSLKGYLGIANQVITGGSIGDIGLTATTNLVFGSGGTTERMRITDYGSLVVGNTPGTNVNWGKIQCGGSITVGNSSGTYIAHGRISGDSDGMKLQGTSTGSYGNPSGITVDSYSIGINTNSPDIGNGTGDLVIRSWATVSRLAFWNSTSGEVSNRGQRISFENANCIFENLESGYYAFKTAGSEKFRIRSDGNVGIGSTNPDSKLKVEATSGGSVYASFRVGYAGVSANYYDANTHNIRNGNSSTQYVTINSTGVGIGSTSPAGKLTVEGPVGTAAYNKSNGGIKNERMQMAWYTGQSFANNTAYTHIKTNLWMGGAPAGNTQYIMGGFIAKSYSYSSEGYGEGRCMFHNWNGTFYNLHVSNVGDWTTFMQSPYTSSDGYCVIVLKHNYYSTPQIDFFQEYTSYPWRAVSVTVQGQSSSNTGLY